jgi:hypothetical protein
VHSASSPFPTVAQVPTPTTLGPKSSRFSAMARLSYLSGFSAELAFPIVIHQLDQEDHKASGGEIGNISRMMKTTNGCSMRQKTEYRAKAWTGLMKTRTRCFKPCNYALWPQNGRRIPLVGLQSRLRYYIRQGKSLTADHYVPSVFKKYFTQAHAALHDSRHSFARGESW